MLRYNQEKQIGGFNMIHYSTENLKKGYGVAIDWFGGKIEFPTEVLEIMKADDSVRKIYFNFDGTGIRRVK